ncbi:homogentisate 1,2-dioxygenase [Chondrus crispus]|uniref:homogentisate 1,2-dioxygenase n=1 Tax=Chondrus crispus TaxID=2769 RepID=R7QJF1_CHOCR|nr:homogentisate 1,2-dioxygenase [Chondrus crispus]CDF37883.1 homogentisate 1,2-dioxygenase [Chondrus crispus]|eukprot:XP_005717754.1 homogentisate 1,2-dioxygenase [Chondrus crispus]
MPPTNHFNMPRASTRRPPWPVYQFGFGNEFTSEAIQGALPPHNNPKRCPYGLYAEQISGTAFTMPRHKNRRTWTYRIRPSAAQENVFPDTQLATLLTEPDHVTPERLRWGPIPVTNPQEGPHTFVEGLITIAGAGDPADRNGLAIYTYTANKSMINCCFSSSDGDMLIVPEKGTFRFQTELGDLVVPPGHIVVIPRGIRFAVKFFDQESPGSTIYDGAARGYVLEVYSGSFELPNLGPIGANGLANPRDFRYPTASFDDKTVEYLSITKYQGGIFKCRLFSSPFDVVAWHGNYAPFAYDLSLFCPMNSVRFDHPDPSIFTVLTVPGPIEGLAVADFVIFPPRWSSQENTFRLPYFHRNCMSEYMGVIFGAYEAKDSQRFGPGCSTLHAAMAPHGPDAASFKRYMRSLADTPTRSSSNELAFMFETSKMLKLTDFAMTTEYRDTSYPSCWNGLEGKFEPNMR